MTSFAESLRRCVGAVALFSLATAAPAVRIDSQGSGQALIFPYYTTAAGNGSLLTLTNYTFTQKVVQLRVAEGERGGTVALLNVYLDKGDTWTAQILQHPDGRPGLAASDATCTYPLVSGSTELERLPGTVPGDSRRFLPFALPAGDTSGATPARLREGFVEAVELATIRPDTASSAMVRHQVYGRPRCELAEQAWEPGGAWTVAPLADFANPTGGLAGNMVIVNVANGTVFALPAVTIADYRVDPLDIPRGSRASVARHLRPTDETGSLLDHAVSDPVTRTAIAQVATERGLITLTYPPERAIDAISAVFTAAQMQTSFEEAPEFGARSSYLFTYPTRAQYADPARSGSAVPLPPFGMLLTGVRALASGPAYKLTAVRRDSSLIDLSGTFGWPEGRSPTLARLPGTVVELLSLSGSPDPLLGTRLHADVGRQYAAPAPTPIRDTGWLQFDTDASRGELLRASLEGRRLVGVPVIALRLTNYTNTNASPGVLANYSFAVPVTTQARCVEESGASCSP